MWTLFFSTASDFSPARIPLLRWDGHSATPSLPSQSELSLRVVIMLWWLVDGIVPLAVLHMSLSVVFVCLLRVDAPEEWPPLFGSPLEAYSLRRFWSRTWHRLLSPSALMWARWVSRRLGLRGSIEKIFVPFFVFTLSGSVHAAVAWKLGGSRLDRDMWFFWANFVGITGEVGFQKMTRVAAQRMWPGIRSETGSRPSVLRRVGGLCVGVDMVLLGVTSIPIPKV